jgi:sugar/nucleoside kinase (ribokinase family)
MAHDILGLGCVAVDELLEVEHFPTEDVKAPILSRRVEVGGTTATALLAASKLGIRCAYAGILGDDPESRLVLQTFQQAGIDGSLIRRDPAARPIRCTIFSSRASGSRTVLYDLSGAHPASLDWPTDDAIRAAKLLLVDQFGTEAIIRAARICRAANIPVVADLEQYDPRPEFLTLIREATHLVFSRELALRVTGCSSPAKALERLRTGEQRAIVVTAGAEGAWFVASDFAPRVQHQPAYQVRAKGTTGCGDVFRGAYSAALLDGLSVAEAVRFGSAAAALRASAESPSERLPGREAVLQLIATCPAMS